MSAVDVRGVLKEVSNRQPSVRAAQNPGGVQTHSQRAALADQPTVQMRDAGRSKEQTCRAFRQKGTAQSLLRSWFAD